MGAITSAVVVIAGVILGWITIEIACKPCLDQGRQAIDRSLNPDYDPDDDENNNNNLQAPLNPPQDNSTPTSNKPDAAAITGDDASSPLIKTV